MAWAKIHTDMLDDPKLMRAARGGLKDLDLLPWLVVFAKRADDDGRLSVGAEAADASDIARGIPDGKPTRVQRCIDSAFAIGVLVEDDDGVMRFTRWTPRQGKPSDTPERTRHRKQASRLNTKKAAHINGRDRHTLDSVTVTGTDRGEQNRTEGDRGEEIETRRDNPPRARALEQLILDTVGNPHRNDILGFVTGWPDEVQDGWAKTLLDCLQGLDLPGGRACTTPELASVCRDMKTKTLVNARFFRQCIAAVMRDRNKNGDADGIPHNLRVAAEFIAGGESHA